MRRSIGRQEPRLHGILEDVSIGLAVAVQQPEGNEDEDGEANGSVRHDGFVDRKRAACAGNGADHREHKLACPDGELPAWRVQRKPQGEVAHTLVEAARRGGLEEGLHDLQPWCRQLPPAALLAATVGLHVAHKAREQEQLHQQERNGEVVARVLHGLYVMSTMATTRHERVSCTL